MLLLLLLVQLEPRERAEGIFGRVCVVIVVVVGLSHVVFVLVFIVAIAVGAGAPLKTSRCSLQKVPGVACSVSLRSRASPKSTHKIWAADSSFLRKANEQTHFKKEND